MHRVKFTLHTFILNQHITCILIGHFNQKNCTSPLFMQLSNQPIRKNAFLHVFNSRDSVSLYPLRFEPHISVLWLLGLESDRRQTSDSPLSSTCYKFFMLFCSFFLLFCSTVLSLVVEMTKYNPFTYHPGIFSFRTTAFCTILMNLLIMLCMKIISCTNDSIWCQHGMEKKIIRCCAILFIELMTHNWLVW